jgi:hypothetical protein
MRSWYVPGLEIRGGKRLLQRHLVAVESHQIRQLGQADCGFAGDSTRSFKFDRCRRSVALLIHRQFLHLLPYGKLLIPAEVDRLVTIGGTRRRDIRIRSDEGRRSGALL